MSEQQESTGTVLLALSANVFIAVLKLAGGLLSGSSAMLSESAHSIADSMNEVFLLIALRRSERPPDALHPFGYGKERYVWSMLAAVGIFVTGACFSAYEGLHTILGGGEELTYAWLLYAVLAVAMLAEGSSWTKAVRQVLHTSHTTGRALLDTIRDSRDTTVTVVLAEDSAAVVGLVLAALGLLLHQVTGSARWEGVASLLIAVLLAVAAFGVGRQNMDLLIGQSAQVGLRLAAWDYLSQAEGVNAVLEVLEVQTMQISDDSVLLAARVDLDDGMDSDGVEELAGRIRLGLAEQVPEAAAGQIFLDITDATPASAEEAHRVHERLREAAGGRTG